MPTDATPEEARIIAAMRARFNAQCAGQSAPPPYLEASVEEIDGYLPHLIREHGSPPLVIRGPQGHLGYPFKGVPLVLSGGEEYM